jgi:protease-4
VRPSRLVLLALLVPRAAVGADLPEPWPGGESVAVAEGAVALPTNPAGLALRYPSEVVLAVRESGARTRGWGVFTMAGGFGLAATGGDVGPRSLALGLGGGGRRVRLGASTTWLDGRGSRAADHQVGLLSRPTPWLSMGAVASHLSEPRFEGARLDRAYTLGLGLRPFALSRVRAAAWGPRLTLAGDVLLGEDDPAERARVRFSAELEPIPGLVLRGSGERDGYRVGVSLLGLTSGYHGHAAFDQGGDRRSSTHAVTLHGGEDRTAFAGPRARRIAQIRVSGRLADESLGGVSIFGGDGTVSSASLHRQLERVLEDPLTRGVLLDLRGVSNMAQLEELRVRIARLRAAGKPVVAFLEYGGGRGDLYLASACDRIVATEEAVFAALGLRAERRYYRALLESWGFKLDRASVGRYKSGFRNFSVDSTPPADREQIEQQLDAHQALFVETVAADRRMDRRRLEGLLDGRWWPAAELARAGLIDSVGYRDDALAMLGRLARLSAKPRKVSLARTEPAKRAWLVPRPVAVVYASGGIETGRDGNDLLNGPYMGSETTADRLERAFRDPEVKAVVLRVESPGGSGLGSNLILHQARLLKRETKKPLIVSMGSVAASGGYYISLAADRMFADRFTRTGSIGVYYVKPSLEGWYEKHRVRQEDFERGPFMGAWSPGLDWTPRWQAAADSVVRFAYDVFKSKLVEGRGLGPEAVEAVSGGRVWMGDEARERRLVDEIGGLQEAVAEARRRAGVPAGERIELAEFRRPRPNLVERLAGMAAREAFGSLRLPALGTIELRADVGIEE